MWNCVDKMGGRIGEERTHLESVSNGQSYMGTCYHSESDTATNPPGSSFPTGHCPKCSVISVVLVINLRSWYKDV